MITGNKGEWSEIYALFKILGDKNLFAGDADLNRIENLFYPIIKIIRHEIDGNYEYEIKNDIVIVSGGRELLHVPVATFSKQALNLLTKIRTSTGSFGIIEIESFMNSIYCNTLKAKSTAKSDIKIVIHDKRVNQSAELGFKCRQNYKFCF